MISGDAQTNRPTNRRRKIRKSWDRLVICFVCGQLVKACILMSLHCRFLVVAVEGSKRSPELIQLLDMRTNFASGTITILHICKVQ